jgi:uncharacterized protein (DUF58 family)
MLVPTNRLILWTALVTIPFSIAAGTIPGALPIALLIIAGFLFVAAADALVAPGRLAGIRAELPSLTRLQKDRPGNVELTISHPAAPGTRPLRVGIPFPPEIATAADRLISLPAGATHSRVPWDCVPAKRGRFLLRSVHLEAWSSLGFWAVRTSQPAASELRVYPDLLGERRRVSALFLKRAAAGAHTQRQAGQGREFEKLRDYLPGDSLGDIHWKASAKRGKPVTKVHQVERSHEVYVVVDASRLSSRLTPLRFDATTAGPESPRAASALERYVTAALLLGLAAEQQGDQFGLITFSDRVTSFVRARGGQAHFDACRDRLFALDAEAVSPDFEELCSFIRLRLRKRALLIFLTALDDPMLAESFSKAVELICREHLILANILQPAGAQPLFSAPEEVSHLDDLYRRLGGHLQWHALRELQKSLQRRGVRLAMLDPEKVSAELIAQHAEVRARQLV